MGDLTLTILILIALGLLFLGLARKWKMPSLNLLGVGNSKNFLSSYSGWISSVAIIAVYLFLLLVVFPQYYRETWDIYWGDRDLFWTTQGFLAGIVIIGWIKNPGDSTGITIGKGLIITICIGLILGAFMDKTWWSGNSALASATYTTRVVSVARAYRCPMPKEVVARPGVWSEKVKACPGYDWLGVPDPKYGIENARALISIRVNGNDNLILQEGLLKDGTSVAARFPRKVVIHTAEYKSETNQRVHRIVRFMRK